MSTQSRLDAYLAAEARILSAGFSVQLDQRRRQEAELAEVRRGIRELEARLAGETRGAGTLRYKTAVFD